MEKLLRPDRLDIEADSPTASLEWNHWYKTFQNFLLTYQVSDNEKLRILINHVSPVVYELISDAGTYNDAVCILKSTFTKTVNEVFARHKLATRRQQSGETVTKYLEILKFLSKDCNFKAVTAETNRNDCIRDAFIAGLRESNIRQRLLENPNLTLEEASRQAKALESAIEQSLQYQEQSVNAVRSKRSNTRDHVRSSKSSVSSYKSSSRSSKSHSDRSSRSSSRSSRLSGEVAAAAKRKCYFCGYDYHRRSSCPAREETCKACNKLGHFARVCRSSRRNNTKDYRHHKPTTAAVSASTNSCLKKAIISIKINGIKARALVDTGSSLSFISEHKARQLKAPILPTNLTVSMASTNLNSTINRACRVDVKIEDHFYPGVTLNILPDLCADAILGHDVLSGHSSIEIKFGGSRKPLNICGLTMANVEPVRLFRNVPNNVKPIAIKSRRHTASDAKFIELEVQKLLKDGIIEESYSPWRAQVLVTQTENHKRRMVIDYSQTINRYTELDAYPLPRIDDIVNAVASYEVFSSIDLKSAYYQIAITDEDKPFTAFEAAEKLWQFRRIPFGPRNAVACFQRTIHNIITREGLTGVYAYLDDITVCGKDQAEHDANLSKFLKAVEKYGLTLNEQKSVFSVRSIKLLGYVISNKTIRPDPDRLRPLRELPLPTNTATLKRAMGMFAHFSNFIPQFSKKIQVLTSSQFPLNEQAAEAFRTLKSDVENALVSAIDEEAVFTVETDASDHAIGATLSQNGRPIAFYSRTLNHSERRHSAVEKEAYAIVEAVRKWRHYLLGRHFRLLTDQKSVSFMFDSKQPGKVKNEKIMRWRLELSCFDYEIVYRPGRQNEAADALSRICSVIGCNRLKELHEELCHPGVTRFNHWIKMKNLPYSLEDIKKVTSACRICAELKPRFNKQEGHLIKATRPFERLNVDFKGPLPSNSRNRYLLIVVDEFSRFPFAFPCHDLSASTVINKLQFLFTVFGLPSYIHSDRGSSFMSQELKTFLTTNGIATSRTTPYNPQGNGQAEKFVGTVWKTIELALRTKKLRIQQWELVVDEALHSIRSLLCTATNETPHERMFKHPRKSNNGCSTPSWLLTPGPVLLRRNVRNSKYEPLVDEVTLLEANPEYAFVRLQDGRETTVSTRHLAPPPTSNGEEGNREDTRHNSNSNHDHRPSEVETSTEDSTPTRPSIESLTPTRPSLADPSPAEADAPSPAAQPSSSPPGLRRSSRNRRLPGHLKDFYLGGGK